MKQAMGRRYGTARTCMLFHNTSTLAISLDSRFFDSGINELSMDKPVQRNLLVIGRNNFF